jgi:hypothetical protein
MGTYTNLIKQKEQSPTLEKKLDVVSISGITSKPEEKKAIQKDTQKVTQISKSLSSFLSNPPSTENIEKLNFQLRKIAKVRVNADIPLEWKDQLDDLAHTLRVGKYELLLYMIAVLLGKIEKQKSA